MFQKEIFEKVGLFDETLVRNQDDEFNFRLFLNGEKVFISSRAKCTYYVRETPRQLFWQYYEYGYWRAAVLKKHRRLASVRHTVPVVFFLLVLVLLVIGLSLPGWWRLTAAVLPAVYLSILLTAGLGVGLKEGVAVGLMFPVAATIMHFAYAAGLFCGFLGSLGSRLGYLVPAERWSRGSRR